MTIVEIEYYGKDHKFVGPFSCLSDAIKFEEEMIEKIKKKNPKASYISFKNGKYLPNFTSSSFPTYPTKICSIFLIGPNNLTDFWIESLLFELRCYIII